jgi:hypothetical protein
MMDGTVKQYGNGIGEVRRAALAGAILSLAMAIVGVVCLTVKERWGQTRPILFFLLVLILVPSILALVVGATALLSVHVGQGKVQHVFLRRFILQERRVEDFVSCGIGASGPILRFRGGRNIYLVGMHLRELQRLASDFYAENRELPSSS